jgi:hypothetical protein
MPIYPPQPIRNNLQSENFNGNINISRNPLHTNINLNTHPPNQNSHMMGFYQPQYMFPFPFMTDGGYIIPNYQNGYPYYNQSGQFFFNFNNNPNPNPNSIPIPNNNPNLNSFPNPNGNQIPIINMNISQNNFNDNSEEKSGKINNLNLTKNDNNTSNGNNTNNSSNNF